MACDTGYVMVSNHFTALLLYWLLALTMKGIKLAQFCEHGVEPITLRFCITTFLVIIYGLFLGIELNVIRARVSFLHLWGNDYDKLWIDRDKWL